MREGEGEIEGEKRERWENREKRGKGDEQHKAVGKRDRGARWKGKEGK